jgi:hypothetical protein
VAITDTFPVVDGIAWSIDAGNTTGAWKIEGGKLERLDGHWIAVARNRAARCRGRCRLQR